MSKESKECRCIYLQFHIDTIDRPIRIWWMCLECGNNYSIEQVQKKLDDEKKILFLT
jgi:hypothetical protein